MSVFKSELHYKIMREYEAIRAKNEAAYQNIKKQILLKVTKENRSYDLKSTIEEGEWNY